MYEWKTCDYWSLIFSLGKNWPNLKNQVADLVDFFTNIGELPVANIGHQCQDTTDEWLAVSICNLAVCSQESCIHMYTQPLWGDPLYPLILVSLPWPDIVYLYTELGKQKSWESSPLSFLRVMTGIAADSHRRFSFYLSICSGASSIDQNRTASPKMVKF